MTDIRVTSTGLKVLHSNPSSVKVTATGLNVLHTNPADVRVTGTSVHVLQSTRTKRRPVINWAVNPAP